MKRSIFVPSAAVGVLLIVAYGIWCLRKGRHIDVAVIVDLIINGAGLVAGVVIAASTVYEPLRTSVSDLSLYILISGFAVVAVSLQSIARAFRSAQTEGQLAHEPTRPASDAVSVSVD